MTVALVLPAEPAAGPCGQLTSQLMSLGVRRVDATEDTGPGAALLTVAAAARTTGEQMLICGGDLAVPRQALARLLGAERTAGYAEPQPGCRPCSSTPQICGALAEAAEYLASRPGEPDQVSALLGELSRRGVTVEFVEARPDGDADRDEDGLVAEFFADPIARDVARWAAERALAPAALIGISLGLGLVAAIWFSEPTATAKAVAAVTLLAAFVSSRAGRFLAAAPGAAAGGDRVPRRPRGLTYQRHPARRGLAVGRRVGDHGVRGLRRPGGQFRPRRYGPRRAGPWPLRHSGDRGRFQRRVAPGRGGSGGAGRPPDDRPLLRARHRGHGRPDPAAALRRAADRTGPHPPRGGTCRANHRGGRDLGPPGRLSRADRLGCRRHRIPAHRPAGGAA